MHTRFNFLILIISLNVFSQSDVSVATFKDSLENYYVLKQYDSILLFRDKDFAIKCNTVDDSLYASKALHIIANTYYNNVDYFKAIKFYNESINIVPHNEDGLNQKGKALYDRAFAEYEIQNYNKSYKTVQESETILSDLKYPDYDYLLSIYADLAGEATYLGFYEDAELYLHKGFKLYQKHKEKMIENSNAASKPVLFFYKYIYLYALNGNENAMLQNIKALQELSLMRQFNSAEKHMQAVAYNHIGDYYLNKFKTDSLHRNSTLNQGNIYLNNAIDFLDREEYPDNYTQILFNKAKYHRYSTNYELATAINTKIIELAGSEDIRQPFFVAQKALIFLDANAKEKALEYHRAMVRLIHASNERLRDDFSNFKPSTVVNHTGLLVEIADEFIEKHPNDKAVLKQMSSSYQIALKQLSSSYQSEWFSPSLKKYYNKIIKGMLKMKFKGFGNIDSELLLEQMELIENRLTWKTFLHNRALGDNVFSDAIFDKEIYLRRQIINAIKNNDTIVIQEINNQLKKQNSKLQEYYPKIYEYAYQDFNITTLKNNLKDKTVLIKYKILDNTLYKFVISKDSVEIEQIPFDKSLKLKIKNYIQIINTRNEDKILANEIWEYLKPENSKGFSKLIIIPDEVLNNLPFETLVENNEYLVINKSISYLSHLVFLNNDIKKNPFEKIAVFTQNYETSNNGMNALKGVEYEVKLITKHFSNYLSPNTKNSKTSFFSSAPKADILHLAMHAKIDKNNPELSHFIFDNQNEDSNLYLEELYALKLKASLAVLSACNTGVNLKDDVNGSASIQRAFFMAGVPATISSLWNVPDKATEEIMSSFYGYIKTGESKTQALKFAKTDYLNTIEDDDLSKPYYWAGFVLYGDTAALNISATYDTTYAFIFCVLIVLLITFLFKRFKKF